jgi:hypothetical protein
VVAATAPVVAATPDVTLTMDDLPMQPVHGLNHPSGVQFGFTVGRFPDFEAIYASNGPGTIVFVEDPSIEGPSNGVLSMTFTVPTPLLRFGVAQSIGISTAAFVELFDASNTSLTVTSLALEPMPLFAEGQFSYSGQPVKRASVRFVELDPRFALDNLVFSVVPEPTRWVFACWTLLLCLASRCTFVPRRGGIDIRP